MNLSRCRRILFSFLLGLVLLAARPATADLGFSAAATPSPVAVSNTLTYTFSLTNVTGLTFTNIFLTNQLSFALTTNPPGWVTVTNNTIVLPLGTLQSGLFLQTNWSINPFVTGIPTNAVFFTNTVTLVAPGQANVITNLVTPISIPQGDLGVSISIPTQGVLVNDVLAVDVTVTNLGPDTVPNVLLTNVIPTSFKLLSPTNLNSAFTNGNLVINLGSLTNRGSTNLHLTFQPTNSGGFVLGAVVLAASLVDINLANNTASTNVSIGAFLEGTLTATIFSAQQYNPQTGLMEQTIRLSNTGTNDVPSARVIVSGLTNWLYNAVGTNAGLPFVTYNSTLGTNQSVFLLLEYFVPTRVAVPDPVLTAIAVPAVSQTASTNSSLSVTKFTNVSGGGWLVEFVSIPGRRYTVLYTDNSGLTWSAAQPVITAPADRTQWIDNGPPKTATHPTNTVSRLYRVLLNP